MIDRINADRGVIEGDENALRNQSVLPNCELVLMLQEKIGVFGSNWGRTFEFVRTQSEAVEFFPKTLRELHEHRVDALGDTWQLLEDFSIL